MELKERALSVRVVIISAILFAVFLPISEIILFYTDKPGTLYGWPISTFLLVLIMFLLGKLSKRLRLSPSEFAMLLIVANFIGGSRAVAWYCHTEQILRLADNVFGVMPVGMLQYPEYWNKWTPGYLYPMQLRTEITGMIMNGLSSGQVFPWDTFLPPLMVWVAFTILMMFVCIFVTFAFIGPTWVRKERLPFAAFAQTPIFLTRNGMGEGNPLFDFKHARTKVFYVFLAIGLFLGVTPLVLEIFPMIPLLSAFEFGWFKTDLTFLPSILPGAKATGWFNWFMFFIGLIVPNDVLFTSVICFVIFDVLWNAVAFSIGAYTTYTPGNEFQNWCSFQPYGQAPFPIAYMGGEGMTIGMGIILFWVSRDRFKVLFEALRGKDTIEDGLSMRFLGYFGVVSLLATWLLMTAVGIPPIIALEWLFLFFTCNAYMARIAAEYYDICWSLDSVDWKYMYPTGAALGYWPMTSPSNQTWFITRAFTSGEASWVHRCGAFFGIVGLAPLYKILSEFKVNLKHAIYMMIAIAVIGTPLVYISSYWLVIHGGGYLNTNLYQRASAVAGQGVITQNLGIPGANWSNQIVWLFVGMILSFVFYGIKVFFPMIPINPYMIVACLALNQWAWQMALASLIVRVAAIRVVGAKTYNEYALAVVAGVVAGYGTVYTLTAFTNLFQVCLPKLMSLFVP